MPYEGVATNRNLIRSAVFQQSVCLREVDLRVGVAALCLRCRLIQHVVRLQLVAEGDAAAEVLLHQIHKGRRGEIGCHNGSPHFEIAAVHIFQRGNIFLNGDNGRFRKGEIVDVQSGGIVALEVDIHLGNLTGEAELDVGKFCPVAVGCAACQIAVVAFAGSVGVFQTQLYAVVPFSLGESADGVLLVGLADIVHQELRAVPALARSDTIMEEERRVPDCW